MKARKVESSSDEEEELSAERLGARVYIERLKHRPTRRSGGAEGENPNMKMHKAKAVVPGAEYLETIPHAPWPSRAMLKRRVVLGTKPLVVKNGVTKIVYPSGDTYEGQVKEGKRHGNGIYCWKVGDSFQGMWYSGLPHGLGVAEYRSGAAYVGEWYLGDRQGHGMYFYAPHPDEPHREYAGQWRNDMLHGAGKRLSKDGTLFLGGWRKGLRHGDGICRVTTGGLLNPLGAAANVVRRARGAGATGRFGELDAKQKHEVDLDQVMGGVKDWHHEELGITLQEGRFNQDDYEPRDKTEIKRKKAKLKRLQELAENPEERESLKSKKTEKGKKGKLTKEEEEQLNEGDDEDEDPNSHAAIKRRQRQARLKAIAKHEGRILASRDFPEDYVDEVQFEPIVQTAMETSDAAELVGKKVRAMYHGANFPFRVAKYEGQE